MQGDDAETIQLTGAGGVQQVANWKELLTAINPGVASGKVTHAQMSHGPFEGSSFHFMANVKQLVYNPKLHQGRPICRRRTPSSATRNTRESSRSRRGPRTGRVAPAVFDEGTRMKWLDVVRAAGKNGIVLSEVDGTSRVVLGQYQFALAQDAYVRQMLAKDPQAPIAATFFQDYNELNGVYYSVRTSARAPAAAALWALWMTTPESEAIWQPENKSFQPYGSSDIDVDRARRDPEERRHGDRLSRQRADDRAAEVAADAGRRALSRGDRQGHPGRIVAGL